jgi:potassium efflux system protein
MSLTNTGKVLLLLPVWILFNAVYGFPQSDSADLNVEVDKDTSSFSKGLEKARQIGKDAIQEILSQNKEKQIHSRQLVLLDKLGSEYDKASERFKRGIDTAIISQEIKEIEDQFKTAAEGTYSGDIEIQTMRNLNTSDVLMSEILTRLKRNREKTESILGELIPMKNRVDSLMSDTILFLFSRDSAMFTEYSTKLIVLFGKFVPLDSSLTEAIKRLRVSQNYMINLESQISTVKDLIEDNKGTLATNLISKDVNNLTEPEQSTESIADKLSFSNKKARLVLGYYLKNNFGKVILLFFAFLILVYFTVKVRNRFDPDNLSESSDLTKLLLDHPILSSSFICLTILQFLFSNPPVIFSGIIWTLSAIILTLLLWNYLSGKQLFYWLFLVTTFLAAFLIDLLLKESQIERIVMLVISIAAIAILIRIYKKNVLEIKNSKLRLVFFAISFLLLAGSAIANLAGRYNLSKLYLTVCFFAMLTAILLHWAMVLFSELINASAESYKSEGNLNFQNRVQKIKFRMPVYLKYLLFVGWIILIGRNLYFYDKITSDFMAFIEEETAIGDFSFSLEKLLLFVFIILLSTFISKAVSFYADRADNSGKVTEGESSFSGGLSNWMLLIRIGVISIGVILAFAATGLPLDKLTLIIGSLGVGIGLGLQSVVNNLVSGVILAFEKPFKIGDYIEVSDEEGRIKEIGIRSSKLSTAEGADVIIPNGELLSKHVINWTLRDSRKRSELILSIKYDNKLIEIRDILQRIMDSKKQIEKSPPPIVLMNQFSIGTAEYRMLYWTSIYIEEEVKSDLIIDVEAELKMAGIELSE